MSNKSFCDKCGNETQIIKTDDWGVTTKNTISVVTRNNDNKKHKSYDLCDLCLMALENWLSTKPNVINIGDPYNIFVSPNTWDGRNVITCLGDNSVYCATVTGRMSCKEPNLSNIPQNLPKFTTP